MNLPLQTLLAIRADWLQNALSTLSTLETLHANSNGVPVAAWSGDASEDGPPQGYERRGNVALLPVRGVMEERPSYWSYYFGGCSTEALCASLAAIEADPSVTACVPVFDTPGGVIGGTANFAQALVALDRVKPVIGYVTNQCCAAGMWAASGCRELWGSRTALVGDIGLVQIVRDSSEAAARAGVKVHAIGTSPHKGAGVPGTVITDTHKADFQRVVDSLFGLFKAAVQEGRRLTDAQLAAVADGRVWVGPEAVERKLLDRIGSLDEALARAQNVASGSLWRWKWPQERSSRAVERLQTLFVQMGASETEARDALQELQTYAKTPVSPPATAIAGTLPVSAPRANERSSGRSDYALSLKGIESMSSENTSATSFSSQMTALHNSSHAIVQRLKSELHGMSALPQPTRAHRVQEQTGKAITDLRKLRETAIATMEKEGLAGALALIDKHLGRCGNLLGTASQADGVALERLIDSL